MVYGNVYTKRQLTQSGQLPKVWSNDAWGRIPCVILDSHPFVCSSVQLLHYKQEYYLICMLQLLLRSNFQYSRKAIII